MRARSKTVFHILRRGGSQPCRGAATLPHSSTELVLRFHTRFDQSGHWHKCWQRHWGEEVACLSITHRAAFLEDLPTPVGFADVGWKVLSLFSFKQSFTCPGKLPAGYTSTDMGTSARNRRGASVQPMSSLDILHFSSPGLVPSSLLVLTGVVPLSQ